MPVFLSLGISLEDCIVGIQKKAGRHSKGVIAMKKILAAFLALSMLLVFAGCGNESNEMSKENQSALETDQSVLENVYCKITDQDGNTVYSGPYESAP